MRVALNAMWPAASSQISHAPRRRRQLVTITASHTAQATATSSTGGAATVGLPVVRYHCQGPPSSAGSTPSTTPPTTGPAASVTLNGFPATGEPTSDVYAQTQTAVTPRLPTHNGAARRSIERSGVGSPAARAMRTARARANKGTITAFAKNARDSAMAIVPVTAYRLRPVRTSNTASPATHARPACNGSAFTAAAHQANPGRVSGENR